MLLSVYRIGNGSLQSSNALCKVVLYLGTHRHKENFFLVLILGTKSKYMQVEKFSLILDIHIKTNISEFNQSWCFL